MANEKKNPWGRGPEAERERPITDISKNPFKRHRDKVVARHAAAAVAAAGTKKIKDEAQKHFNATHQTTMNGTVMDGPLAAAKKAYDADLAARGQQTVAAPTIPFTGDDYDALWEHWLATQAVNRFFRSTHNVASMLNYLKTGIRTGRFTLTIAVIEQSFLWLASEGYLEFGPGEHWDPTINAIVRKRGDATRPAAELYPPYEDPAVKAAEIAKKLQQTDDANRVIAKAKPLDQLQKEVRSGWKPVNAGSPGEGGVR